VGAFSAANFLQVLQYEEKGSLCIRPGCLQMFCSACTKSDLPRHRHTVQTMIIKEPPNDSTKQAMCTYCKSCKSIRVCHCLSRSVKTDQVYLVYLLPNLEGLWCEDCGVINRHFMCLNCMLVVQKGENNISIEPGLPHQKLLKQCKVKLGWFFYVKRSST
jgi:hypothetical protein